MATILPTLQAATPREPDNRGLPSKQEISKAETSRPVKCESPQVHPPLDRRSPLSLRPNAFLRRATQPESTREAAPRINKGGSLDGQVGTSVNAEQHAMPQVISPKVPQPSNMFRGRRFSELGEVSDCLDAMHSNMSRQVSTDDNMSLAETNDGVSPHPTNDSRVFSSDFPTVSSNMDSTLYSRSSTPLESCMGDDPENLIYEVKDAILEQVPDAQVVLVCTTKPEPTEKMSWDLAVIEDLDPLQLPTAPENVGGTFLLVEDSPKCVLRACKLLRTCSGPSAPRLVCLLTKPEVDKPDFQVLANYTRDFIDSGAHDAITCGEGMDLPSAISTSLARANVRKHQNLQYAHKVQKSRNQCDRLFWSQAHDFIEGFPEMREGMREVQGKVVENMVFESKLGQGAFGTVYGFKDLTKQRIGAVKVMSKSEIKDVEQLFGIVAEYSVLRKLSGHANVVEGYALVHGRQNIYIFMEKAGTSSLFSILKKEGERGLPEAQVNSLFKCISDGMAHCHKLRVAHCDLKPENMVVKSDGSVKIVDFGEAEDLDGEITPLTHPRGTMPFTAPEILHLRDPWNPAQSDVWALGVVLMELLCGYDALPRIMGWPRRNLKPVPERADEVMAFFADFSSDGASESHAFKAVTKLCRNIPTPAMSKLFIGMLQLVPEQRLLAADVALHFSQP